MLARYMPSSLVCVCLCVCPLHANTVLKRLNIGSRNYRHTKGKELYLSAAKDRGEIRTVSYLTGAQNAGGVG